MALSAAVSEKGLSVHLYVTLILFSQFLRSYSGAGFIEATFLFFIFQCILSDAGLGFKVHVKLVNKVTTSGPHCLS